MVSEGREMSAVVQVYTVGCPLRPDCCPLVFEADTGPFLLGTFSALWTGKLNAHFSVWILVMLSLGHRDHLYVLKFACTFSHPLQFCW